MKVIEREREMEERTREIPDRLGRYEVRGRIGGGGMGEVYRVYDPVNRREVALKVLKFTYPRALHYFKREFRAVAGLSHPNLVALYDLHHEGEQYFYTMEIIDGVDLYLYVNGHNRLVTDPRVLCRPDRAQRVRQTIVQLLQALAYLHEHGCIHRDIKPSNVLVDRSGQVKLVDFGIVKELLPGGEGQSLSQVFGTSTYFSPEQSLGSSVTAATDVYAVGVVLYELLAGTPPFEGDSADVAQAHRTTPPPSLVQRVPGVPADLAVVCMELLSKAPEERPSAREALEMLDAPLETDYAEVEFVGRRAARKALHRALETVRDGRGRIALIEGPSGAGKSALVETFAQEARLFGASTFTGTCLHRDHVALRGLDTMVERLAEAYRKQCARIMRHLPEAERAALIDGFTFLGELLPPHMHGMADGSVSPGLGLQTLLREVAEKRLLIVVLEHLHLADPATLDVIEVLQRGGGLPPCLFVITLRPDAVSPNSRLAAFIDLLTAHPGTERIVLEPFTPEETMQFLELHLGKSPAWLADHVQRQADGVPLFVQALVAEIRQNPKGPPPTFDEMVTRRMAALPDGAQRALAAVCLCRGPVPGRVLERACGLDANGVHDALQALIVAGLVRVESSTDGSMDAVPVHRRLMHVARGALDPALTRQMHVLLAKAWQTTGGSAGDLRHHWREAGEAEKAARYAAMAAAEAQQAGDHVRAAELFALALDSADPRIDRVNLYLQQADCLTRAGRALAAAEVLGRLAEEVPDEGLRWTARRLELALVGGRVDEAITQEAAHLPEGARVRLATLLVGLDPFLAEELVRGIDTPEARLVRARILAGRHDPQAIAEARELVDSSIPGPTTLDRIAQAHAQAVVCRAEGAGRAAETVMVRAWELARDLPAEDPMTLRLTMGEALLALEHGDVARARAAGRELLMAARARGLTGLRGRACTLQAHIHLEAGERNAAGRLLAEAASNRPGGRVTAPHVYSALTRVRQLLYGRRLAEAESGLRALKSDERYRRFLVLREHSRDFALLYTRLCAVAGLELWRSGGSDDPQVVERLLRARLALARTLPRPEDWLRTLEAIEALLRFQAGRAEVLLTNGLADPETRPEDPRVLAIQYAVIHAAQAHQGREDEGLVEQAREVVREVGAALPVEATILLPPMAERPSRPGNSRQPRTP
ncbi:MAG: serine/threonine-protein kinase [bacterium]